MIGQFINGGQWINCSTEPCKSDGRKGRDLDRESISLTEEERDQRAEGQTEVPTLHNSLAY